ncbi:Hsp20/alpha crystallin family protein [Tundrisphaera sp. TA3]|uniref:Hsp20/alpha crystallin family protein n=1 Tax=Tundrisphaera sp. TA3 TaxID=3435775 RepID=UPI003EB845D8
MAIERWDPFREMVSLRDAMNMLMQESFVRPVATSGQDGTPAHLPLDITENGDEFVVKASLPGVKPEDVEATVHGDTLLIRAESRADLEKKGDHWHLRERRTGVVQRAVSLAAPVDPGRARANFEDGVLTLTLPKAEHSKPRQIRIGGASRAGADAGGQDGASSQAKAAPNAAAAPAAAGS